MIEAKPKRVWDPGPVVTYGPIRRIGKFFSELNTIGKREAKQLAHHACTMSKPAIDRAVYQLEQQAKYNNFEVTPKK